jgi:hypothetical protein
MSIEADLLRLARDREAATETALVRRQLRGYLSRQVDLGRIQHTKEKVPRLMTLDDGVNQLTCPGVQFAIWRPAYIRYSTEEKAGRLACPAVPVPRNPTTGARHSNGSNPP